MEDKEAIWKSNLAIIEKRGGNLAAPVPKPLGESGYINELTEEDLYRTVEEYKALCETYPRKGAGVDMHCVEVGLEDPQAKKMTKPLASTLLALQPSSAGAARSNLRLQARSTPPVTASAVAEAETVDANAYVGRFDGSNSKHASPAMAAAAGKLQENEDLTALPTSTKWSVLSSRVEGLVAELSQVVGKMDAYCVSKSNAEGPAMAAVREKMIATPWAEEYSAGHTMFSYGEEMSTDPLEAMLIKYFSFMAKPKRILEIGMFVGYGAVSMLEGWPSANVVSLEIDPYLKDWLASCLKDFPELTKRHEIVLGPALDSLPTLEGEFDMVFIDANKAEYKDYVQKILDGNLLAKDGVIVCDNILYNGYPYVDSHFDAQPARRGFGDAV
jgi:predicted O-methyltransferase YrrM